MKELELIENKELRAKYIERLDVLEKVKGLLLLPDINLATRQQVADFYNVDESALRKVEERNKEEIKSDGFTIWKAEDFKTDKMSELKINKNRGSFEVEFSNGETEKFSPRGVALYTRRAILRIGMLLKDSEVAKEVRTQLLNIEGKTTYNQKVEEINEEQRLVLNVVFGKDELERANATRELLDYKNKYIDVLEDKIESLVNGILTWDSREGINRMVRKIAFNAFKSNHVKAWDKVYAEMLYKHNISIKHRKTNRGLKNATAFDVLDDNEIKLLVRSCLSLCEMYKIDISDLMVRQ